jgi:hypothetical protein
VVEAGGEPPYCALEDANKTCPRDLIPSPATLRESRQIIALAAAMPRRRMLLLEPLDIRDDRCDLVEPTPDLMWLTTD